MSHVRVTNCEAQNTECQIKVAADLIYILIFCSPYQAFNSVAKWWSCLCVDHKWDIWKPILYKLSDILGCFAWSDMQNHKSTCFTIAEEVRLVENPLSPTFVQPHLNLSTHLHMFLHVVLTFFCTFKRVWPFLIVNKIRKLVNWTVELYNYTLPIQYRLSADDWWHALFYPTV
jgi:hypothetical protein